MHSVSTRSSRLYVPSPRGGGYVPLLIYMRAKRQKHGHCYFQWCCLTDIQTLRRSSDDPAIMESNTPHHHIIALLAEVWCMYRPGSRIDPTRESIRLPGTDSNYKGVVKCYSLVTIFFIRRVFIWSGSGHIKLVRLQTS